MSLSDWLLLSCAANVVLAVVVLGMWWRHQQVRHAYAALEAILRSYALAWRCGLSSEQTSRLVDITFWLTNGAEGSRREGHALYTAADPEVKLACKTLELTSA